MDLPKISGLDLKGKKVLVRTDLDFDPQDKDNFRLQSLFPTLDFLQKQNAKIILLAHRGRPRGKVDPSLSLKPFTQIFTRWSVEVKENLRFSPGEEENSSDFSKELASWGDCFVNEAFAASHRKHASIVSLPKLLPSAAGLHFEEEVNNLSQVLKDPASPVVFLISGFKDDKLEHIKSFKKLADKILIAGRLPEYIHDDSPLRKDLKIIVANLIADKEDISIHSIEVFINEIKKAKTILVSGPIGKFEEAGHSQGTKKVFQTIAESSAFKVAGGGETLMAIQKLGLEKKFSWLSTGGGAMLAFLANGTLPGIEALLN